ncbi:SCO family protein [Qipengyuania marisflavi]|uniref:SCO family protein n=2 Tax=Qipengyuania marisflavi TaxID=2486356 RepID=A0A5S3P3Z0_9SPHN|nr:SCO family protein [Qipengyuania marisflavi]
MLNRIPLLAALSALCLASCTPTAQPPAQEQAEEPPLQGATIGGPFVLIAEDGSTVRWDDFAGQYRIIYFGYAYCPDICPTDVQRAMTGLKQFAKDYPQRAAMIQPLFVSIDPERDTPAVLTEFTDNFHPDLIGLTGTPEQLEAAAKAFASPFSRGEDQPGGGYLMEHLSYTYLFSPEGEPLATLPTDEGPEAVAAELARWVR